MSYKKTKIEFARAFSPRSVNAHKGDFGKVLLVAGSKGFTGAAYLAASAAVRAGAGLVTVIVPESLNPIFAVKLTEAMTFPVRDDGKGFLLFENSSEIIKKSGSQDAIGIGPGLGGDQGTMQLIRALCVETMKPVVLDADGLNAFVGHNDIFKKHRSHVIITPHEGEFERLFGNNGTSREERASAVAGEYDCVVVLKGARTVVASPAGDMYINMTGNPGMASGGTGDCLLGIITAFVAYGLPVFAAAKFGVFVHGLAGDIARDQFGEISMNASDLLNCLPQAFVRLVQ